MAHRDTDTPILHTIISLVVAHRDTDTPILHTIISLVVAHRDTDTPILNTIISLVVAHRDTDTPILHTVISLVVAHRDTDTPILHTVISLVVAHRRQRYLVDMPCVNYVAESQFDNIIMLCWFGVLQPECERRCTYISSPTIWRDEISRKGHRLTHRSVRSLCFKDESTELVCFLQYTEMNEYGCF